MNRKTGFTLILILLLLFVSGQISCVKSQESDAWLEELFTQGRADFYSAVQENITTHPKKDLLTAEEIRKIMEAESLYPRLYEILINIFYQKDEPVYQELMEKNDRKSRDLFKKMYEELVDFTAEQFIAAFFMTDWTTEWSRTNQEKYKDMDAVDLVIRSIGYDIKKDIPEREMHVNPVSPEFDKQDALDAAGFRQALEITKGKGVKIAILDTGIDVSHSIFKNTAFGNHFSIIGREGPPWASQAPFIDWGAHGTLISSIAARYAPEAEITAYKFGDGELMNDPAYQWLLQHIEAAAVYKAVHDGNDIISISASGATVDVDYLREACRYAFEQNRIVISGALYSKWYKIGARLNFPSQYENVVTITAAGKNKDGSYGYWDVCAPGEAVDLAVPNVIFGAFPTYFEEKDTYIPSISAAIPAAAALFALVESVYPPSGDEAPGEYAGKVMDIVFNNADPSKVGFTGFTPECGRGMIDALKSVQEAAKLNKERKKDPVC